MTARSPAALNSFIRAEYLIAVERLVAGSVNITLLIMYVCMYALRHIHKYFRNIFVRSGVYEIYACNIGSRV